MIINGECYVLIIKTCSDFDLSADAVAIGNHWCFGCLESWLLPADSCKLHSKNFHWIVTFPDWSGSSMGDSGILYN